MPLSYDKYGISFQANLLIQNVNELTESALQKYIAYYWDFIVIQH